MGLSFGPCCPVPGLFASIFIIFYISFQAHPASRPADIYTHAVLWGLTLTLSCILPGNYWVITAFYRILPDFSLWAGNRHSRSSEHENYRVGNWVGTLPRAGWRRRSICRVQVSTLAAKPLPALLLLVIKIQPLTSQSYGMCSDQLS